MEIIPLPRVLISAIALFCSVHLCAQTPAPAKAAAPASDPLAEAAFDAFFKLRDLPNVAPSGARFTELIKSGLPLLVKYPKNRRVGNLIGRLSDVAQGLNDKKLLPLRDVWFSQLKFELLNVAGAESLDDDARAALTALGAASANAEARLTRDRETLEKARDKIDALAAQPAGRRFLADQEMGYVEALKLRNTDLAEKQVRSLTEHADKGLAARASDELRLMDVRKQPFDLTLTTLDGKEFNAAALRGKKAFFIHFWSAESEFALSQIEQLKDIYADHRDRIEIVSVSLDSGENRAKVEKLIKDKKLKWPQVVEGLGNKSETAGRLSVRSAPRGALFDPKGMLVASDARPWQVVGELKKMGFKF